MQSSENDLEHDLADMGDETDCHIVQTGTKIAFLWKGDY